MPDPSRQPDERLERYLDGVSSDAERRVVETWLAGEPAVRSQIDLQERVDQTLRTLFDPPRDIGRLVDEPRSSGAVGATASNGAVGATASNGAVETTASSGALRLEAEVPPAPAIRWSRWRRSLAVAAAIALAAAGVWLAASLGPRGQSPSPYGEHKSFATFYAETIASGFEPQWVCDDDHEFRRTFAAHYRQPLLLHGETESVRMLGLSYVYSLSPRTTVMLARADGAAVMVFIDRIERDPGPEHLDHDGLNLFRRRLGGVVLYELTPNEQPHLLDRFRAAEEDAS